MDERMKARADPAAHGVRSIGWARRGVRVIVPASYRSCGGPRLGHYRKGFYRGARCAAIVQVINFRSEFIMTKASRPRSPGEARRRQVMGDAFVDRALSGATAFTQPLQDLVNDHAWGSTWQRGGIDLKQRSLCTVARLAARSMTAAMWCSATEL